MSEQLQFLWDQLPNLLWGFPSQRPGGLLMSVLLSAASLTVGFVVAIVVSIGHHAQSKVIRWVARRYVWLIRGIPLLVLLVLLHQLLNSGARDGLAWGLLPGVSVSPLGSAFIALALYSSAYLCDVLTAGIQAMPQHYVDDARVLGASRTRVLRTVTLPYVLRVMRPALVTQAITVFKDSSVVVVLGVADLTTTARIALGSDVANAPYWVATYGLVGLLYFIVAFGLGRLATRRGLDSPDNDRQCKYENSQYEQVLNNAHTSGIQPDPARV